ncbi:hypothetical protein FJT64_007689 [Amphibalanus amphitrite]|uniref:Uncharacterized protein n=1 Tax=Amphibalanus amphitrite TaxID=1232801 RepID=A0A6A4VP29_AMPAM|nr:hypothetical protein FJT64_007689 [Amphibalanus amphitrite]
MKFESVQMLTDVTQMFAEQMAVFRSLPPSLCHLSCAANPRCLSFITEPEMVCRLFRRRGRPVVPADDEQMELGQMMHKYRLHAGKCEGKL